MMETQVVLVWENLYQELKQYIPLNYVVDLEFRTFQVAFFFLNTAQESCINSQYLFVGESISNKSLFPLYFPQIFCIFCR